MAVCDDAKEERGVSEQWLEARAPGFRDLPDADRRAIFDFAFLWSLFEPKSWAISRAPIVSAKRWTLGRRRECSRLNSTTPNSPISGTAISPMARSPTIFQSCASAIYCEAQSADSWEALTVLTPDRVRRLHDLGFTAPGRVPNYWRHYPLDQFDDAKIARELLTVLHDVYGYRGQPKLRSHTEEQP